MKIELSVIIPMFNEEENIINTLNRVIKILTESNIVFEIICVDDGSTDSTKKILEQEYKEDRRIKIVSYSPNCGRGKALIKGFEFATGEIVITIDADLSYDETHIIKIYDELVNNPDVDVVFGSAYMKGGKTFNVPFKRLLISKLGNYILRFAIGNDIKTITCVLRGYKKYVIDSLVLYSEGKEIHLEILSKILALGYKIKEIPAILKARTKGKSKFKFRGHAVSHLIFAFYEKPINIFLIFGSFFIITGIGTGIHLIRVWIYGDELTRRPIIYLTLLLLITGVQILATGLLSLLIIIQKKEQYRSQAILMKIYKMLTKIEK